FRIARSLRNPSQRHSTPEKCNSPPHTEKANLYEEIWITNGMAKNKRLREKTDKPASLAVVRSMKRSRRRGSGISSGIRHWCAWSGKAVSKCTPRAKYCPGNIRDGKKKYTGKQFGAAFHCDSKGEVVVRILSK